MRRVVERDITTAAVVLGIVEALLIATAVFAGTAYLTGDHAPLVNGVILSTSVALIIIVSMHWIGLYGIGMLVNLRVAISRIACITGLVFALAVVTTGLLARHDILPIYPYRWQWTFALTSLWMACVLTPRLILNKLIDAGYFARRVIIATTDDDSARLNVLAQQIPHRFVIAAHLSPSTVSSGVALAAASAHRAPEIIVSLHDRADRSGAAYSSLPVTNYPDFYERETGRVDFDNLDDNWTAHARTPKAGLFERVYRRTFDILVALIALVVAAPIMIAVAIAIRIEDGKPILFRQTRVGLNGREFTLYKLRSMRVDAETLGAPMWAADNDPRITRVGWFIRKLRIDELPQFYNVLRGEMSFIGPRPERPYFVHQLSEVIPHYRDRHLVRPGITGWAQVSFHYGASFEDARHKTAFDLYYVKHRSVWLDLVIIFRTIKVVLWPQGVR
jgi:exopolysaccharide biosynthesis polyprenyl glycosylphosphotransferase